MMKKILAICLTLVMVFSLSISSFAAPGSFVISPSGNPTPKLVVVKIGGGDALNCGAHVVITSYADREELSSELKEMIEYAYDDIAISDDLTDLNADLAKVATDKKIDGKKLAVSDLFDIHVEGCKEHNHTSYEFVIETDTLDKFVGLLHMPETGKWELVNNAAVVNNGTQLKFSVDSLSPFAIVVESMGDTPQTGDNSKVYVYAIVMAVSALALVLVIIINKRKQNKQ